jgi:hypothetical protein
MKMHSPTIAEMNRRTVEFERERETIELEGEQQILNLLPHDTRKIPTPFGRYLELHIRAGHASTAKLATVYAHHPVCRRLHRKSADSRRASHANTKVSPPKKEIGNYRKGYKTPGPEVAYKIGRSLEILAQPDVEATFRLYREVAELTGIEVPTDQITEGGATCGLDALVAAGFWADAIACLGQYVGREDTAPWEFENAVSSILAGGQAGSTLPGFLYPEIDDAWINWVTDRDVDSLPPRFAAAYRLALSDRASDRDLAEELLTDWSPRLYR